MGSLDRRSGPLYRRVADDILDQIHSGTLRPGDKLPSERALCDLYQVSQITVRRALRELRHSGLLVSRHGLGWYVQNGAAHRGETPEAVLVLPEMDWLAATLVRHLAEEIAKGGQALRLSFTGGQPEAEDEALEAARGQGAAAVLAIADGEEQALAERYARFLGGDTPLLLLVREVEASGAPAAYWDQEAAVAMATRHLLESSATSASPMRAATPTPSAASAATGALPTPCGIAVWTSRWTGCSPAPATRTWPTNAWTPPCAARPGRRPWSAPTTSLRRG